jgi:NADH:ubiquinone oxidoreductase subunit B-like Fe-S oxidoreductase
LTLVLADALCPLSSITLQVTVIVPGAAPTVESIAEGVVPLMEPAVAL